MARKCQLDHAVFYPKEVRCSESGLQKSKTFFFKPICFSDYVLF